MSYTQKIMSAQPETLKALLQKNGSLRQTLEYVEAHIRARPDASAHRMFRFNLLCLLGEWEKALKQLQICARLNPDLTPLAYVYRDMIRGEQFRAEVFRGERRPPLPESAPSWLSRQLDALALQTQGAYADADAARREALDGLPDTPGIAETTPPSPEFSESAADDAAATSMSAGIPRNGRHAFRWISDSDTRLGPVLEAFVQGQYRWIPFADLAEIRLSCPAAPPDLIWLPVQLRIGGEELSGFLPARYPGSEDSADVFRLGRETRWEDVGDTGVVGLGQKVWTTDQGDLPLYDVRHVVFNAAVSHDDPDAASATSEGNTGHAA